MPFFLITKTISHVPKNDSNVVIYGGHADVADYIAPRRALTTAAPKPIVTQRVLPSTTQVVHRVQRAEDYDDRVCCILKYHRPISISFIAPYK